MSNLTRRKKEEQQVLTGQDKYSDEKPKPKTKNTKGRICTGKRCLYVTMALPAIWKALTELGHAPDPSLLKINENQLQTTLQTVSKEKLWKEVHNLGNITAWQKKRIEELEKELKKERQEVLKQKQLVKHHANQGVIGAVSKGIKTFIRT